MVSSNVLHLRENGPSPPSRMPSNKVSPTDRMNGVWKFTVLGTSGYGGARDGTGGHVTPMYYLRDEHGREEVLGAFLDANPRLVEAKTRQGLRQVLRKQGRQWHEAIDEVLPADGSP